MPSRVSLAELLDADVTVRPDQAVAILREICRQHAAGDLRGIPNATVIRLTPDGRILVEGPVNRDQAPIPAAAALLSELLPGFDTATGYKVPGGLRLVIARAARTLDVPPFASLSDFCAALERFAAADLGDTVRTLYQTWEAARDAPRSSPELTISDVRRARRATGLSLEDVAQAAAVPAAKLRELEWGYLRNWSPDATGRDELGRYARAAGLDEALVIAVAWPMIEAADREPRVDTPVVGEPLIDEPAIDELEHDAPQPGWALLPASAPSAVVPMPVRAGHARPSAMARHRWAIALVAAVLLVIAAAFAGWDRPVAIAAVATPQEPPIESTAPASRPAADAAPEPSPQQDTPRRASLVRLKTASDVRPATPRRAAAKAPARKQTQPRKPSFFKRPLLRIVFR